MIFLLVGRAGAGKDTAADAICARTSWHAYKIAQADPLKSFASVVFGFSDHQLYGPSEARSEAIRFDPRWWQRYDDAAVTWLEAVGETVGMEITRQHKLELDGWMGQVMNTGRQLGGVTARQVLQTLGTEYGRRVLGASVWVDHAIARAIKQPGIAVITDGRFRNEAARARVFGARVIKVVRTAAETVDLRDAHASEREQDTIPADETITNDLTPDFQRQVLAYVDRCLFGY